eukprot:1143093-Pelagomonas_calceolata.AAC.1
MVMTMVKGQRLNSQLPPVTQLVQQPVGMQACGPLIPSCIPLPGDRGRPQPPVTQLVQQPVGRQACGPPRPRS